MVTLHKIAETLIRPGFARSGQKLQIELQLENIALREVLIQAELNTARLLLQANVVASKGKAEHQEHLLLQEEMHHRVKNILAMAMALTSQSLKGADTVEEARVAIERRLMALGRAQDVLVQADWVRADMHEVIKTAIAPYDDPQDQRFTIQGKPFVICATAVLPIIMTINELCTNAIKHGSLSIGEGRVDIKFRAEPEADLFKLSWVESGGSTVGAAKPRFGSTLIVRLAEQLNGEIRLDPTPHGYIYDFVAPLRMMKAAEFSAA